jgi:hypothetical protein
MKGILVGGFGDRWGGEKMKRALPSGVKNRASSKSRRSVAGNGREFFAVL